MCWLGSIRSIVAAFVVPAVLVLVGVFATLALIPGPDPWSDRPPRLAGAGRVHVRDQGADIRMCVDVPPGENATALVLTSLGGRELARLICYRDGALVLESTQPGPTGFTFHRGPSGSIDLGVRNNPWVGLHLLAPADGSSEFLVQAPGVALPLRAVRVSPTGETVCP